MFRFYSDYWLVFKINKVLLGCDDEARRVVKNISMAIVRIPHCDTHGNCRG